MMSLWFSNPNLFGALYGGIGGTLVGIAGGVLGAAAGLLAPKGKGRSFVLGGMGVLLCLGLLSFFAGIAALLARQPFAIWYPLTLLGIVPAFAIGSLLPVVRNAYAQAEARRLDAALLRNR